MVNARPILPPDLTGAIAQAGVVPTLEGRALQDAIRSAIGDRRGYCSWDVDHAGWVVTLHHPDEQIFYGRTLDEALAWCLVWLMASEIGVGQFADPTGIGVDGEGNVYVADAGNDRIQKFAPTGTTQRAAAGTVRARGMTPPGTAMVPAATAEGIVSDGATVPTADQRFWDACRVRH